MFDRFTWTIRRFAVRKNVIVVGAPRSGTSLTASILAARDYYVGPTESDPDEKNPLGYFESAGLVDRNVEVFNQSGFHHQNTWLYDTIDAQHLQLIESLTPCNRVQLVRDDRLVARAPSRG